jgi:predicted cupin superfamily sugar epimerase
MTEYRLAMTSKALSADEVIAQLKLKPHPEGGYYRETFRDAPGTRAGPIRPPFSFC